MLASNQHKCEMDFSLATCCLIMWPATTDFHQCQKALLAEGCTLLCVALSHFLGRPGRF
jgi:hypothetical protein